MHLLQVDEYRHLAAGVGHRVAAGHRVDPAGEVELHTDREADPQAGL